METCQGCGIILPQEQGLEHPYMKGSPSCWKGFGLLLEAQYSDLQRMRFHQLVVDSYAVQHPGSTLNQQVQSVGIHLMTLALFIEDGLDPSLGTQIHQKMVERPVFSYLPRPSDVGTLKFDHIPLLGVPRAEVYEWATSSWNAWSDHHSRVDSWLRQSGLRN
jgi:hypothetical protein